MERTSERHHQLVSRLHLAIINRAVTKADQEAILTECRTLEQEWRATKKLLEEHRRQHGCPNQLLPPLCSEKRRIMAQLMDLADQYDTLVMKLIHNRRRKTVLEEATFIRQEWLAAKKALDEHVREHGC